MIVRLKGGLGNQMFQYAFGKSLSRKRVTDVKFDLTPLLHRIPGRKYVFRSYDLDIFDLKIKTTLLSKIAKWGFPFNDICFMKQEILIKIISLFNKRYYYKEKGDYIFDEKVFDSEAKFFDGYFQSHKYFESIADEIRKDFSLNAELKDKYLEMADKIKNCNSVCLNVRRTDYVNNQLNQDFFGFIGLDYFKQAVNIVKEKISDPVYFIFSDDVNWCREQFGFLENKIFVGHEYAGKKFANYLKLMMLCKNFIIPNSTFAWWATWLSSNNGIVVAPKNWVRDGEINNRTKDLIPDSWIRI